LIVPDNPYAGPASEVSGAKIRPEPKDRAAMTYSNGLLDLALDQAGVYWRNPIIALVLCALICWASYDGSLDRAGGFHVDTFLSTLATFLALIVGSAALIPFLLAAFAIWRGSSEAVVGPFQIELSEDGVTRETSTQKLLIKWRGVHAVRMGRWYMRIYITPSMYLLIPRRAFILEHEAEDFFRTAKHYLELATPSKQARK